MTIFAACEQIPLPMTGNSAVFNLRGLSLIEMASTI
jgi:hypothetical protein